MDTHSPLAYTSVASVTSQAANTLVVQVNPGDGVLFSINQQVTICPSNSIPTFNNAMICRVTGISTDQLTMDYSSTSREGSSVRSVLANDQLFNSISPKAFIDIESIVAGPPEGFMFNGKIVTSVASTNLTVALKTLAGTDATVNSPIYVRIGSTLQKVTAALSVTLNAGTKWFNAGSAELATNEIDYFVYLGFNSTDGVVLGFSRIPYATTYADFSVTTTNEKYAAISTITHAAGTDAYVVVGRFNATLSAGAGYTWTVGTLILNRPVFETRNLSVTGQVTSETGTITSVTGNGKYTLRGRTVIWSLSVNITTNGTGATRVRCTYAFAPDTDLFYGGGFNRTDSLTGLFGIMRDTGGGGYAQFQKIDNTYPGADGAKIAGTFNYSI